MIEILTVEEIDFMCVFDISSRENLIGSITNVMEFIEDDMTEIADNVLKKLSSMDDAEFNSLELYPTY